MEKEDKQIWEAYNDIACRNRIEKMNPQTAYQIANDKQFFIRRKTESVFPDTSGNTILSDNIGIIGKRT